MTIKRFEISEEEYNTYSKQSDYKISEFITDKMPDYIKYGYGFYGSMLIKDNDKYYIEAACGDNNDY